jgi:hypothetical protein
MIFELQFFNQVKQSKTKKGQKLNKAKLKILQLHLWLEPAQFELITMVGLENYQFC